MKQLLAYIFAVLFLPAIWFSCNNSKTYAQLLEDEQNAINKLITDSGFKILYSYPANKVFAENEFVKLPNGLYMNVIDSGNGTRVDSGKVVLYRIKYYRSLFDTTTYSGYSVDPYSFIYGQGTTSSNSYSEGLATPLSFVGQNSKVRLIVPSSINTYTISQNVVPYYYYVTYPENVMDF
ncbi:MAG: DUF4827 domain-containing protein [Candidatus Azobacteroides sp.]|nr:DUF4827 domain-containing protein [Candidatus Azobacteroides sp.]